MSNNFRIIAIGDIHDNLNFNGLIIEEIRRADLIIITGDLTEYGGIDEARKVIDYVSAINPILLAQPGNLDNPEVDSYFSDLEISINGRGKVIENTGVFGVGGSNKTPFLTPNELSEERITDLLVKGYNEVKGTAVKIMVPHMPPFNTSVDKTGNGLHVGSAAVRDFIEHYQPDICITGHIHESSGVDTIGSTSILNPGPLGWGGFVSIDIKDNSSSAELKFLK